MSGLALAVMILVLKYRIVHIGLPEMIRSMLDSYGIPSIRRLPGDGAFGELILGMSGNGIDIFVPETQLADAQELVVRACDHLRAYDRDGRQFLARKGLGGFGEYPALLIVQQAFVRVV